MTITLNKNLDEWDCFLCDTSQVWKQRSMYYSIYSYLKDKVEKEEKKKAKAKSKSVLDKNSEDEAEPKFFLDETIRDCADVHKILGNYLDRAKKSWAKKRDLYTDADVMKATVKLRTIFKITHHNLEVRNNR